MNDVIVSMKEICKTFPDRKKTVKQSAATDSCVMREEGFRSAFEGSGFELLETQYGVGFDKSDAILGLIDDGFLLATMAQNPDVMGSSGVEACVKALEGTSLGGAVTDTGVSVLTK